MQSSKICEKRINEIDKTLQTLGSSSYFSNMHKKTIYENTIVFIYTFILTIIIAAGMILHATLNKISIFFVYSCVILHLYGSLVQYISMIYFITVVRCIKSEFQRGNELLSDVSILPISSIASEIIDRKETKDGSLYIERSLPVNSEKLFTSVYSSKRQTQFKLQVANYKLKRSKLLLRTIRQVHLELYRISKNFSKMYGIQISLEIAICVLSTTYILYDYYEQYFQEISGIINLPPSFVIMILCSFHYSTRIFMVNYICYSTTNEAERTNEIIHTFYGKSMDEEIKKEVEIFSMQMMQFRNAYSAFGLHNFDCKQICSCLGVITTYLVIMIQVADSIRHKS
ncbi:hypothetical protein M0804_011303 [Polistes exclamans]|nr:hypothetical protein M0804_011303 [Polistes exclamans]